MSLAFAHPDRITAVMILGTQSLMVPDPAGGPSAGEATGLGKEPTVEAISAVLEEQLYHHDLITPEVIAVRQRAAAPRVVSAEDRAKLQADRAAERDRTPAWTRLDELPVPLCMLYGADDRPNTKTRVALMRERYPNLDLTLIDHCKHIIQWDAQEVFEAKVGSFFG